MKEDLPDLVARARQGDRVAFSTLVEKHRRLAAGVAYGILGDVHLSADAVQDAFVKAWQGLDRLRDASRFPPWFLQIVRTSALDIVRRRSRLNRSEYPLLDSDQGEDGNPSPEAVLVSQERSVVIRNAIRSLPSEYREVILLKHAENRSYREIARLQRTTVKAVEARLYRARILLEKLLERENRDQPDGKSAKGGGDGFTD